MQSGRGKTKKWILKFESKHDVTNPLMGWESNDDTMGEMVKSSLEFMYERSNYIIKSYAIDYAKE